MKAILLAAGFGTRLQPLTNTIPKCLVPVSGKPLLGIWLEKLIASGFDSFLVNTHYLSEQVEDYIGGSDYSKYVALVYENELLGTAGTLMRNLSFYGGMDGLLMHADNYCTADFNGFLYAHENRPDDCLMTMMTFRADTPSSCGIVELDDRGVVVGFHEKIECPPGDLANGAIYLLSSQLLFDLEDQYLDAADFSNDILPKLVGKIFSYESDGVFVDIGTPESYKMICDSFKE